MLRKSTIALERRNAPFQTDKGFSQAIELKRRDARFHTSPPLPAKPLQKCDPLLSSPQFQQGFFLIIMCALFRMQFLGNSAILAQAILPL